MKIMVCTDGSEHALRAIRWAANYVRNFNSDLIILHIIRGSSKEKNEIYTFEETTEEGSKILEGAKLMVQKEFPDINVTVQLDGGHVAKAIVEFAEKEQVDGIVLGTRGAGEFKRLLLGSVAQKVIVYAHCPVTVVR